MSVKACASIYSIPLSAIWPLASGHSRPASLSFESGSAGECAALRWAGCDTGNSIVGHVAGVDDFEVAEAAYRAAVARWPAARITCGRASGWCMTAGNSWP
jgi:hypothetical protein